MTNNSGRPDAPGSPDSDAPLDPAAMYALLQNQQRSVETQMGAFVPYITLAWGLTWLIGFGSLWLIDGLQPAFSLPLGVAVPIFIATVLISGGFSAWLGIRSGRGMRGNTASAFTGTVYGVTWSIGATALAVFGGALRYQGMSAELANFYYPSAYVLFAGIMYVIAGAIWHAVPSVVAGCWLVLIAVVAPFFGYPGHYLFLALAGGIAFLALSAFGAVQQRRVREAANGGHRG
ncbi:hypothetical protein GCM10027413_28570 [Conyzicola nivalis]|uniref:Uncharacterized protein n=1 Tax=Conyzicola nivalis TaxID=1477021 RepID=A0A916WN61_9MICO|nr:hypothetical protein [Conyzicola nivalis]GGB14260.1 hypothetical protein GCM10010979_30940 [Conyzicola nivalis]